MSQAMANRPLALQSNSLMKVCSICGGQSQPVRELRGWWIWRCLSCSHYFCDVVADQSHVEAVYDDSYFTGSSTGYLDYLGEESIQRASARKYVKVIERYCTKKCGRLIDVGAASGFFSDEFQARGWSCLAIEPNSSMRRIANDRFGLPAVASLDEIDGSGKFQLIMMIQVISHLPKPVDAIRRCYELLADDGSLLIETWDRQSLIAKLSGRRWHEWNPPSVLHWFSRDGLRSLGEDHGFSLIATGLPKKQIQIGRASSMVRHACGGSVLARALTVPLALVPARFQVPYFLGDAFWMLFRKKLRGNRDREAGNTA